MAKLSTEARLARPDDVYARLIEAYRDLDEAESHKLSAKLILLLANHIGDPEVLEEALAVARGEAEGT
ncbi:MAG: DUF2783 domain-containing protein [Kiloniellales bacterium]|nr:DUF2783 domain-containing protein [Kiloniellales bacterium]